MNKHVDYVLSDDAESLKVVINDQLEKDERWRLVNVAQMVNGTWSAWLEFEPFED